MRTTVVFLLAALTAGGCAQPSDPAPTAATPQVQVAQPPPPSDAPVPVVIDLCLYQMLTPAGEISQSKEFWQHMDQKELDAELCDRLDNNGVRVGEGKLADWPYFQKVLLRAGASTTPREFVAPAGHNQEIAITGLLPEQTLFFFDRHGDSGAVYDRCQNLLTLSFQPSPRQPDAIRVELCPLVRTSRRHFEATDLNAEQEFNYVSDEHLYDLGLRVDLPKGKFLVVSPSAQSKRTTSIGHQFLTLDAETGRRDLVLIFVAKSYSVLSGAPATQPVIFGN